jgi:hypothetical protein
MSGRALVTRPTKLTMHLPEDIRGRIDLHLFSEVEGCIPKGAYQRFFLMLIKDFFDRRDASVLARNSEPNPSTKG